MFCLFRECRRAEDACHCSRCGRELHLWRRLEARELAHELLGYSPDGRLRYHRTLHIKERCSSCGLERMDTRSEYLDR